MKYALVTGGSRGIGRAVCLRLAQMVYQILINCNTGTEAAAETLRLVRESGSDGEIMPFDVADASQVHAALEQWTRVHPNEYVEVLVNNAGIRNDSSLLMMQPEAWQRVLDITLSGFYNVTQSLLLPMQTHKFGRIINMASVSGLKGLPGQTNYSAAKGAIIAATKALAQEVARRGVTVNAVAPGFIKTDMVEGLDEDALRRQIPANRFGRPEEVAALVGFLASAEAAYITGAVVSINGGMYT